MVNAPGVLPQPLADATVPLALVAEAVSLPVLSQFRLVQRDRLSQWDSQGVEVRLFGKGQPAAQPGVDLDRLGEQLRPPALRLHPTPAGLEGAGDAGGAFQGPVVACRPPFGAVAPFLSVLLSCWDDLSLTDRSPASAAEERIPLLYSYVRSAWREDAVEFLGLSSQWRSLTTGTPDEDFVDVGPEHHGYVVTGAGDRDPDLTRIVRPCQRRRLPWPRPVPAPTWMRSAPGPVRSVQARPP